MGVHKESDYLDCLFTTHNKFYDYNKIIGHQI